MGKEFQQITYSQHNNDIERVKVGEADGGIRPSLHSDFKNLEYRGLAVAASYCT